MQDQQYKMRAMYAFGQIRREYELLPNNEARQQKWTRFVRPLQAYFENPEMLQNYLSLELDSLKQNTAASLRFNYGFSHGSQGRGFQPPPVALYGCGPSFIRQPAAPPLYGYCGEQQAAAYPYSTYFDLGNATAVHDWSKEQTGCWSLLAVPNRGSRQGLLLTRIKRQPIHWQPN